MSKIQRNIRISSVTDNRLKQYLDNTGSNLSEVAEQAIKEYLEREEKQVEKYLNLYKS